MDYKAWLSQYRDFDSPMGDFAHDVCRSDDFPDTEQTYTRLEQYFEYQSRHHHNPKVLELFELSWKFYRELIPEH